MRTLQVIAATAFLVGMTSGVMAQQPQAAQPAPAPAPPIPAVGDAAPDFGFTPIDRSGIAQAPKKLLAQLGGGNVRAKAAAVKPAKKSSPARKKAAKKR